MRTTITAESPVPQRDICPWRSRVTKLLFCRRIKASFGHSTEDSIMATTSVSAALNRGGAFLITSCRPEDIFTPAGVSDDQRLVGPTAEGCGQSVLDGTRGKTFRFWVLCCFARRSLQYRNDSDCVLRHGRAEKEISPEN